MPSSLREHRLSLLIWAGILLLAAMFAVRYYNRTFQYRNFVQVATSPPGQVKRITDLLGRNGISVVLAESLNRPPARIRVRPEEASQARRILAANPLAAGTANVDVPAAARPHR